MSGTMCDGTEERYRTAPINRIGRFWKPWFFGHVQSYLKRSAGWELIPLRDYYHRHSRSIFWEIQDIIPFGNSPLFRYTLGWLSPPKIALLKLTTTEALNKLYTLHHVVQDMLVPIRSLSESLTLFHRELGVYPLWLCPMRIPRTVPRGSTTTATATAATAATASTASTAATSTASHSTGEEKKSSRVEVKDDDLVMNGFVKPLSDDDMFIDIGAYGNPTIPQWNAVESLRRIEKFVRDVGGFQALYADTYMTRSEFREMFDHRLYDRVRAMHGADRAFNEVYDKISRHARV